MSTKWKPGTVAKATVRGVPDVTVMRHEGGGWFSVEYADHFRHHNGSVVTDVRPLVVLDPSDPTVEHFVSQWRGASGVGWHGAAGDLCRLIEEQTRPAIEEPTGLGAVVEDADGKRWVYAGTNSGFGHPWATSDGHWWRWSEVNAVRVLSEGVQP